MNGEGLVAYFFDRRIRVADFLRNKAADRRRRRAARDNAAQCECRIKRGLRALETKLDTLGIEKACRKRASNYFFLCYIIYAEIEVLFF